jgi:2-polyprenyl-6-methoxyphenol hydroxylase-like FAD-dependent oxidoreductase
MHAKTLELLDKLGLAERAVAGGQRVGAFKMFREGRASGEISFFEAGGDDRMPYPFALVHPQAETEQLLLSGLEEAGGRVEWGTEITALTQQAPEGARATVRRPDGSEETVGARWVVGADGAHSLVRRSLGLGFAGETYNQTLFLADVELEWEFGSGQAYAELTPEVFFAYFPMPGDRRFRLLGNLPKGMEGREDIMAGDVQEILDRHSGLRPRISQARWTSVYRTHHRMTDRFRVGRAFLAGDAAHIHSPAGGQGMNTGIGDAFNLAWKLALVSKGEAHEPLLDSYEAERVPFARSILKGSDRAFHLLDVTDPATQRLKILGLPLLFDLVSRPPALQRRIFWFLSQLWTNYRASPAVAESGPVGRLPRAGDRAPYGFFERGPDAGTSIFGKLRGTDHHMLLFEGMRPYDPARLEATLEEIEGLPGRYGAPVEVHRIPAEERALHGRYGADGPSVFLVRPDGHIAYRGKADGVELKIYLDGLFVRRGSPQLVPPTSGEWQLAR